MEQLLAVGNSAAALLVVTEGLSVDTEVDRRVMEPADMALVRLLTEITAPELAVIRRLSVTPAPPATAARVRDMREARAAEATDPIPAVVAALAAVVAYRPIDSKDRFSWEIFRTKPQKTS